MVVSVNSSVPSCPGPLVWWDVSEFSCKSCGEKHPGAILVCAVCGFIATTGNYMDNAHANTEILKSPR